MSNNSPSINLVKNKQIPSIQKFMDWALTVGRLIVILTEIIALFSFVYRFSLDEKLINLHSEIKQKQNILSVLKNDEKKYRNLQDRIALASTFSAIGARSNQTITDIINLIPDQVRVNSFILDKNKVDIGIDVASASLLADFINPFKNYRGIKSISIDRIESKPLAGLSVNITAMLK